MKNESVGVTQQSKLTIILSIVWMLAAVLTVLWILCLKGNINNSISNLQGRSNVLPEAGSDQEKQQISITGTTISLTNGGEVDLTFLTGTPGPAGANGSNGSSGINGSNGSSGSSGSPGVTGPIGPVGPAGPGAPTPPTCAPGEFLSFDGVSYSCALPPGGSVLSAQNGLSLVGTAVELGANPLLHDTGIDLDQFELNLDATDLSSLLTVTGASAYSPGGFASQNLMQFEHFPGEGFSISSYETGPLVTDQHGTFLSFTSNLASPLFDPLTAYIYSDATIGQIGIGRFGGGQLTIDENFSFWNSDGSIDISSGSNSGGSISVTSFDDIYLNAGNTGTDGVTYINSRSTPGPMGPALLEINDFNASAYNTDVAVIHLQPGVGDGSRIFVGEFDPNGQFTANPGSVYFNINPSSANDVIWVKDSGLFTNTGWSQIGGGGPPIALQYYAEDTSAPTFAPSAGIGTQGVAIGDGAQVNNTHAMAFGYQAVASGQQSLAMGSLVNATSDNAIAIGTLSNVTGQNSTGLGVSNLVDGFGSTAVGSSNQIDNSSNFTSLFGSSNTSSNSSFSGSFGNGNGLTNTISSFAIGANNFVNTNTSTAVGLNNSIGGANNYVFGSNNTSGAASDVIVVGIASSSNGVNSSVLGRSTNNSGDNSLAMGYLSDNTGTAGLAIGYDANNDGNDSTAIGNDVNVDASQSVGIGYNADLTSVGVNNILLGVSSNISSGSNVLVVGTSSNASADQATAIGWGNNVTNQLSTAVGSQNNVSGGNGSAFGFSNTVSGDSSGAFGFANTASQTISWAVGYNNTATAEQTLSFGALNNTTAQLGLTFGYQNNNSGTQGSVFGQFNTLGPGTALGTIAGFGNNITGSQSSAFGINSTVSGDFNYVFGNGNGAQGTSGVAVGTGNTLVLGADQAIAFGNNNVSGGSFDGAFGHQNTLVGNSNYALGFLNNLSGGSNVSIGAGTTINAGSSLTYSLGNSNSGNSTSNTYLIGQNVASSSTTNHMAIGFNLNTTTTNSIQLGSGAVAMTILDSSASNNVGIGTTTPGQTLDVAGTVRQSGAVSCALQSNASGDIQCVSDERLKDVQGFYGGGLAEIAQIKTIKFNYKDEDFTHVGFSAQNVNSVLPEGTPLQANGFYGLDSNAIIALSVNAVNELNAKVEMQQLENTEGVTGLTEQVATQGEDITILKGQVDELHNQDFASLLTGAIAEQDGKIEEVAQQLLQSGITITSLSDDVRELYALVVRIQSDNQRRDETIQAQGAQIQQLRDEVQALKQISQ